ncbi:MAG: disulfide bond formation protein B [Candidatus Nanohaloarchaea archaeon]
MTVVVDLLTYSTLVAHGIGVVALAAFLVNRTPIGMNNILEGPKKIVQQFYRETSFFIALSATTGSLYMSEVMAFEPCPLCWYQRIFMYPLVVLFLSAILMMKKDVQTYVVPMALIGGGISAYHYAVQMIGSISSGCSTGISCSTAHLPIGEVPIIVEHVTIPLMALTAFASILVINLMAPEEEEDENEGFEDLYAS